MKYEQNNWVAWFSYDDNGFIIEAGVDTEDRAANVCVTTCENVEISDKDEFNAFVKRDTHLIAAAPDIFEVLREMVDMIDSGDEHGQNSSWHKKAKAALAKATGENS